MVKNKIDYSLVEYVNCTTKVKLICKEHGIFEQLPDNHLSKGVGCPSCNESHGEREISILLENLNIKFERQKKFDNCKDKRKLPFDFYLPDFNMCIEFDGKQHFNLSCNFGGNDALDTIKKHDRIKDDYCQYNDIKLLRIRYDEDIKNKLLSII